MITTQDIQNLETALATGAKTVTVGSKTITYRDLDELSQLLARFKSQIAAQSGGSAGPFGVIQITHNKGL